MKKKNTIILVGAFILIIWIIVAILAPLISPYDQVKMHTLNRLEAPNKVFLLGTDEFGRDILSRLIYGARVSISIGFLSVISCALIGGSSGLLAGYCGGTIDSLIMRIMDVVMAFPAIFLAISIMAFLGPGIKNTILAIAIVYSPNFCRVTRGAVLSIRELDYIESARATGCSHLRIILRHVFPQIVAPITVEASLRLSTALLTESALSFLGLGMQPPYASWGTMISDGRSFMEISPWLTLFPGLAIISVVLAFNIIGDGLRDLLDVRLRNV